nr:YdiU family protein [Millisia brevis]
MGAPTLDDGYARDLDGLYVPWRPSPAPAPAAVRLNTELADDLGIDPRWLGSPEALAVFSGSVIPDGTRPIAQAYAGHQFGGFVPMLGDGRAALLGEVIDRGGRRRDIALKGSGATPFSRGGDGKAALGPVLREYLLGEAMHALGIPTTRALAAVRTGETVFRDAGPVPGAVLTRVASSHLRVGTFEFAVRREGVIDRLADYAIARHYPEAADAADPYLALLRAVVEAQARLIADWMGVGFIHGVMNTDNTTISGETIDYGPCAFLEAYDPRTVFSSIDHGGRYAFGNQPAIMQWNLSRFAETLVGLSAQLPGPNGEPKGPDAVIEEMIEVLNGFAGRYAELRNRNLADKLGLDDPDPTLTEGFLTLLETRGADHTGAFRALSAIPARLAAVDSAGAEAPVTGPTTDRVDDPADALRTILGPGDTAALDAWLADWTAALGDAPDRLRARTAAMQAVNPIYIPRNHLVEEALTAATAGDTQPFTALLDVLADPWTERPGLDRYATAAPVEVTACYRTFCGT